MEANGSWRGNAAILLDDGRRHSVTVDLPVDEDGSDAGTSALELSLLSLAGCIVTIFRLVAARRHLVLDGGSVHLTAERGARAPTIERVDGTLSVRSPAEEEELAVALRLTLRSCPVGVLFERAGVPMNVRLVREAPG